MYWHKQSVKIKLSMNSVQMLKYFEDYCPQVGIFGLDVHFFEVLKETFLFKCPFRHPKPKLSLLTICLFQLCFLLRQQANQPLKRRENLCRLLLLTEIQQILNQSIKELYLLVLLQTYLSLGQFLDQDLIDPQIVLVDQRAQQQLIGEPDNILQLNLRVEQKIQIITTLHPLLILLNDPPNLSMHILHKALAVDLTVHGKQNQFAESDHIVLRLGREDVVVPHPEQQGCAEYCERYSLYELILMVCWSGISHPGIRRRTAVQRPTPISPVLITLQVLGYFLVALRMSPRRVRLCCISIWFLKLLQPNLKRVLLRNIFNNDRSFEPIKLGGLEQAFDELVQEVDRDGLGGQPRAVDVAHGLSPVVLVAHQAVDSSVFVRLGPDAFVVAEVGDRKLHHPALELFYFGLYLLLQQSLLHLHFHFLHLLISNHRAPLLQFQTAFGGADVEVVGLIPGGLDVLHHAGLDFGGILNAAHFLEAAEVGTPVGRRHRLRLLPPVPLGKLVPEALAQPGLGPRIVEQELVHVVAEVAEEVLGFGEAGFVELRVHGFVVLEVWFVWVERQGAAVLGELLLDGVVAVSELEEVDELAVDRALADERAIEKGPIACSYKQVTQLGLLDVDDLLGELPLLGGHTAQVAGVLVREVLELGLVLGHVVVEVKFGQQGYLLLVQVLVRLVRREPLLLAIRFR